MPIPTVRGVAVIDAEQEALFFTSRPKQKFILGASYAVEDLTIMLINTYFGPTQFRQNGLDERLRTVFKPKIVTDLGVTYQLFPRMTVSASVNNVLDVLPEWEFQAVSARDKGLLSDQAFLKTQRNLITFNGRYSIMTYDGFHFSQLGRIFNVSITYAL